jgi:hypothetical protein
MQAAKAMTAKGHGDQFPPPRLSGCCGKAVLCWRLSRYPWPFGQAQLPSTPLYKQAPPDEGDSKGAAQRSKR